mmetsp:Transcript_9722/g.16900  ORF Transcript_9722/g.16900 Transcript_9722/m.16900 type:complete len:97 (-) Transcript_9722:131-421(-)
MRFSAFGTSSLAHLRKSNRYASSSRCSVPAPNFNESSRSCLNASCSVSIFRDGKPANKLNKFEPPHSYEPPQHVRTFTVCEDKVEVPLMLKMSYVI